MLVTGAVNVGSALAAIGAEWNLFLFFLGLMLIAAVADMAGFFDWAAALAAAAAGGSGRRLLFNVVIPVRLSPCFCPMTLLPSS